jgi:hypothetical protein
MPASLEENTFLTDKHILKHLKFHMHVYISEEFYLYKDKNNYFTHLIELKSIYSDK